MSTPGMKTSEFWVMVAAALAGIAAQVFNMDVDTEEFAMIWGPAFAYIGSRGLAKLGVKAPAKK